ncbi:hypothetical protein HMPREF3226_00814 [Prevotella corporis]|uniref:Uncharacterized protein n=1 Tax=Prevotella corporis TaxID=28128 RepID=A0A133QF59_9BACT|nr:hypothetical protein HMPREF3226_00814 [Prevotella corporis]
MSQMTRFKQANHRFSLYESSADIDCLHCFLFCFITQSISVLYNSDNKRSPFTRR